jgi:NAD(P)-dependent dehydrogenase (short-subunit alcohol dehydrogenase family)
MKNDNTQQQTAIVTGASSGIGLGLTQALLAQGYRFTGEVLHIDGGAHAGKW